ncbi:RIKEN cDNA 4930429B21 [Mus musculus]|uniref:Uncharacterized protein n=1 Tax=Mus musculus TaxID=10090 RepID=Q9CQQ1_MOUSE|nr:RIKEN cDNA 4930429B21 [Mus musculus]BAB29758.1 unnamed protein product [Mus musculus]BAB31274.1 unnamed protein product [Mus musculus]
MRAEAWQSLVGGRRFSSETWKLHSLRLRPKTLERSPLTGRTRRTAEVPGIPSREALGWIAALACSAGLYLLHVNTCIVARGFSLDNMTRIFHITGRVWFRSIKYFHIVCGYCVNHKLKCQDLNMVSLNSA